MVLKKALFVFLATAMLPTPAMGIEAAFRIIPLAVLGVGSLTATLSTASAVDLVLLLLMMLLLMLREIVYLCAVQRSKKARPRNSLYTPKDRQKETVFDLEILLPYTLTMKRIEYLDSARSSLAKKKPSPTLVGGMHRKAFATVWMFVVLAMTLPAPIDALHGGFHSPTLPSFKRCNWKIRNDLLPVWKKTCLEDHGVTENHADRVDALTRNPGYQIAKKVFTANASGLPLLSSLNGLKGILALACGGDEEAALAAYVGTRTGTVLAFALEGIFRLIEGIYGLLGLMGWLPKVGAFFAQIRKRLKLLRDRVKELNNDTKERCKEAGKKQKLIFDFLDYWAKFGLFFKVFVDLILPDFANSMCATHNARFTALVQPNATCGSEANYNNLVNRNLLSDRSLQSCSLQVVLEPVEGAMAEVTEVTDGVQDFVGGVNSAMGPLVSPLEEAVDALAAALDVFDPVVDAFEPLQSFFDSLYDAVKHFDCAICDTIIDELNEAVEAVVDAFLKPLGVDMEQLTTKLLEEIGIELPGVVNFAAFDADFLNPLTNLVANIEGELDKLSGQVNWDKFDVTDKLNEVLDVCSTPGAWPVRVATAYDDNEIELDCTAYANTRPVVYAADYTRGTCNQDMKGFYPFPCDDNVDESGDPDKSSCTIPDYNGVSRCPSDPASDESFPGFSSTVFHLTYYCIDQSEDPDVLAELNVVNTDAIEGDLVGRPEDSKGDPFPITGLISQKFPDSPTQTRTRDISCTGELRIDMDARSSRRRKGLGDYYNSATDTTYIQDLSYWDFFLFKENTDGTFGIFHTDMFGGGPQEPLTKEWWTTRDTHNFYLRNYYSVKISLPLCDISDRRNDLVAVCTVCPDGIVAAGGCEAHFCPDSSTPDLLEAGWDCLKGGRTGGFTSCDEKGGIQNYNSFCPQSGNDYDTREAERNKRSQIYDAFYADYDDESCISTWDACTGAKACSLVGCELDYWHYACADFSSDVSNAEVIYHYGGTVDTPDGKTITCPSMPVQQQLAILKAEIGVGFESGDVTEALQNQCTVDPCTINANDFATTPDKTLRVEYICICPAGYDVLPVGGTCHPCELGEYREDSMPKCEEVPAGYHSGGPGARGEKYPCPIGEYTSSTGYTECLECPEGYWSDVVAARTCKECGPGSANPDGGRTTSCAICGPGTQPSATRGECVGCPCGSFGPGDGFCYPCEPGTYANATGQESCDEVPEGGFQPQGDQCGYFIAGKGFFAGSGTRRHLGTGAAMPQKCPEGFTTAGLGSTSVNDCVIEIVPVVCPAEALWKTNSSDKEESCNALVDLLGINITERGNSFCQKCLNVEECDWDGGDCCPETCNRVEFDLDDDNVTDEVLSGSCNPRKMDCLMPNRDLSNFDCTNTLVPGNETVASDCNPNDLRVGNGFCDADLNFEECGYDGGDCCLFSCEPTDSPFCAWDKMNCKDPSGLIDNENPRLKGLPLAQVPVCLISDVPSVPKVTAADDDPCFIAEPDFSELSIADTPSNGQTTLKRTWSVADLKMNMDMFEQNITYFEGDIRLWDTVAVGDFIQLDCALPIKIAVHPVKYGRKGENNKTTKCINIDGKSYVPAAIYGTEFLDVSRVDAGSLVLNGLRIKRTNGCKLKDMDGDGIDDLVCKFVDNVAEWGIRADGDPLVLSGKLSDGTPLLGEENEYCMRKEKEKKKKKKDKKGKKDDKQSKG